MFSFDLTAVILPALTTHRREAFQGDRARTPGGGAGLGLAIAKGFVEAHDGQLNVQNDDHGAIFTVRLPRVRA